MKQGSVDIFGVRIDIVNSDEALKIVEGWVRGCGKHMLFTPNIEFIMAAQKDAEFKKVLNSADLAIPDSSRLAWAYETITQKNLLLKLLLAPFSLAPFLMPGQKFQTLTGVDLMQLICEDFSKKGFTVGFLGGHDGVAQKASECLQKRYPGLKVVFAESGPKVNKNGIPITAYRLPQAVSGKQLAVDVLFVAFGQVKQEKWIANNIDKIPVKIAMGVGGSLDEIAGTVPKAPWWVSVLGLKWCFRLITEPSRFKRQLVLPWFVIKVITS